MLLGLATDQPQRFDEVQDHNAGAELCRRVRPHLERMSAVDVEFFGRLFHAPAVQALLEEKRDVEARWRDERSLLPRRDELGSFSFAARTATELYTGLIEDGS